MSNQKEIFRDAKEIKITLKFRKVYRKPHLEKLGDLRSLTLGGSPGIGDSGRPEFPVGAQNSPLLPPEY